MRFLTHPAAAELLAGDRPRRYLVVGGHPRGAAATLRARRAASRIRAVGPDAVVLVVELDDLAGEELAKIAAVTGVDHVVALADDDRARPAELDELRVIAAGGGVHSSGRAALPTVERLRSALELETWTADGVDPADAEGALAVDAGDGLVDALAAAASAPAAVSAERPRWGVDLAGFARWSGAIPASVAAVVESVVAAGADLVVVESVAGAGRGALDALARFDVLLPADEFRVLDLAAAAARSGALRVGLDLLVTDDADLTVLAATRGVPALSWSDAATRAGAGESLAGAAPAAEPRRGDPSGVDAVLRQTAGAAALVSGGYRRDWTPVG